MKNFNTLYSLITVGALAMSSCSKVLDKNDLSAISEPVVWSDPKLATAFVNNIYTTLPGWDVGLADATDEASRKTNWIDGTTTIDNGGPGYWPYSDIRKMNIFLKEIDGSQSTIAPETRKVLKGQVRFIRAYTYFEMVKRYGGVPLILTPQERTENLLVERNSTKECFDFIINELNQAADELPVKYTSADDLGRITKATALAMKGRVLLFRASPQFNPNNTISLWETAYKANQEALSFLNANGYGLVAKYDNASLFLAEMNKEVIFAIRYLQPGRSQNRDAAVRPIDFTANATGGCHPIQKLVDAFPLKSGKKVQWNSPQFKGDATLSWQNRDDRFYTTIAYNGASYLGTTMALYDNAQNGYAYGKQNGSLTGYYSRKAVDESLDITNSQISGTDFIEMRYAEVLMNMAEAALETGRLVEAFDALKAIRKRAGIAEITVGDPELAGKLYGLSPGMGQTEMRQAVRDERYIEFAFEQKRLWDLRRWKAMDQIMVGQQKRFALVLHQQAGAPGGYTYTLTERDFSPMIYNQNMYFLPLSTATMQGNAKLQQTKGWGNGIFDPLAGL
ncbi:RagB/SusD family nutrient uptake outer membrane protein [Sphingobacterium sp. CZ-UAM]|uniref:RagB/SusD family nutrient uptake outer membrane protein n=1 Tax=Sphingobacterium sp. CZ-UAM TaxID=1933868 RepID=UPI000987AFB4|nr:RagB/SusD family nutrient uptake outer membrane protein [Sphingobacterium sp. CZ-UAM]OOG18870.1 RagB/SusD family nutrient uptake outer membrane protein [Sphingobacterium sp. CZ-UAM]